jgi:hypothetical protein
VSFAVVVLIFRIALVVLLYLFLAQVVRMVYRDLRATAASVGPSFAGPTAAPRVGAIAQLVVLAAGKTTFQVGQEFRLRNPTLIGRDPATDISLDDDFVSGQHLRLLSGPTGWVAQDLNATNGTRLNGTRLTGTAPLKSGDILDIGRLKLRFVLDR